MQMHLGTRRTFLKTAGVAGLGALGWACAAAAGEELPQVDLHVHLDNSTLDAVLGLSKERGIRFGIVEHAGTKENVYPVVLSNDEELAGYLAMLEGKGVYRGVQAEYTDWAGCFSKEMLDKLDFVLTDAFTMPDKNGKRMKLWENTDKLGEAQAFMDRYVAWHEEILSCGPVSILASPTWLPYPFFPAYDTLWTEKRMRSVVDAALKAGAAIEISSCFNVPKLPFLRMAKEAGLKFSFGSNGRYPKMGLLDYSFETAKALGLTPADIFVPA